MNLQHITVLVTGGSRGAGAAIVRALANAGASVIVHYNANQKTARALCDEIGAQAIGCVQEDLSAPHAGKRLWEKAQKCADEASRSLNALVNNAGIDLVTDPYGTDEDWYAGWEAIMAVNVQAPVDLSKQALISFDKASKDKRIKGRIVNLCSRASYRGDAPDHPAYAASKGALLAVSRTFARGMAQKGVLVYALCPGWINTDMAPSDPQVHASESAAVPWGAFADPDEIGQTVTFLLSDACPSMTGAALDINGASYVR